MGNVPVGGGVWGTYQWVGECGEHTSGWACVGNVPVGGRGGEGVVEKVVRSDHSPWPLSEEAAMRKV